MLARNPEYTGYHVGKPSFAATELRAAESCFTGKGKLIVKLIGLVTLFLLAYVGLSAIKTAQSYELANAKLQAKQLQQENDNLRIDIARLDAPERIYTMATAQLGMVAPTRVLYGTPDTAVGRTTDNQ